MILPDYKNNIKNISATFSKFLGKEDGETIKELEDELSKNYKNVVFVVFDGMGVDVLNKIAKNTIMAQNIKKEITSVFPPTTTNATTTLLTNKLTDYHKYLAWCVYFEKYNRCIDIYMKKDSYTGEEIKDKYLTTDTTPYFFKFKTNRPVYSIFPSFISKKTISNNNIYADTIEDLGDAMIKFCNLPEDKFLYCYCTEPDSTMHQNGVTCDESKKVLKRIDDMLKKVVSNTKDTLIVATADHGHIDVSEYIELFLDNEVMECLDRPLSMEPRATSFKLKKGKEQDFLTAMKKYENDIKLIKSDDLIAKKVFGENVDNELRNMLGDYIGVGTNTFKCVHFNDDKMIFKGHHTGPTKEEMYVPLIMIANK